MRPTIRLPGRNVVAVDISRRGAVLLRLWGLAGSEVAAAGITRTPPSEPVAHLRARYRHLAGPWHAFTVRATLPVTFTVHR